MKKHASYAIFIELVRISYPTTLVTTQSLFRHQTHPLAKIKYIHHIN